MKKFCAVKRRRKGIGSKEGLEKLTSSLVDGLLGSSKVKSLDTTGSLQVQVLSAFVGERER